GRGGGRAHGRRTGKAGPVSSLPSFAPSVSYITTTMRADELLKSTPAGLYCEAGGFHIDPPAPVARALITHAHADHARPAHGAVLATAETLDIMRMRFGDDFAQTTQTARYGETISIASIAV